MLQGLTKPVNGMSRGSAVEDIVFTFDVSAIQGRQAARTRRVGAREGTGHGRDRLGPSRHAHQPRSGRYR
jgi:hypothetical protein